MEKVKPISLLITMLLLSVPCLTVFAQDSDEDEEESEDESTDEEELTYEESHAEEELSDEEKLTYAPTDEPEAESTDEEKSTTGDEGLTYVPTEEEPLCDPSYPDDCIPPLPPDLNCGDEGVPAAEFKVLPPDPHGFDDDNDGLGCGSNVLDPTTPTTPPEPTTTAPTNLSNNTATTNTTDTTNTNRQQSTTYNFKEVTFQGSHVWTSGSDGISSSTSGSFHPTSSFDNPERAAQIEGTGRFEMTAHKKTAKGDNCLYEIKGNYGVSGEVKYDNNTSSQHPKGILDVDPMTIPPIYAPLKEGPPNDCGETFQFGYSPMLICNEPVTIDLATKRGINELHREGENEVCILELSGSESPPVECPPVPESASAQVSAMVPVTAATEGNVCPSPNNPPVAVAKWRTVGPTAYVNSLITLDGSESYDPDLGDTIVGWKWTKTSPSDTIVPNTLSNPTSKVTEFRLPNYIPAQFTSRTTPPNLLPVEFALEVVDNRGMKSTNTAGLSEVSIEVKCFDEDLRSAENARDILLETASLAEIPFPQAADNWRYWLSGGGDVVGQQTLVSENGVPDPLPVNWLENTKEFKNAQFQLVKDIERDIKQMLTQMKIGETRTLPVQKPYTFSIEVVKSPAMGTDFVWAVGNSIAVASPHLEVTKTGIFQFDRVSGYVEFKLEEIYDFNKDREFDPLPWRDKIHSHDLYNAIKCLGARNFDQTTAYNKAITNMEVSDMPYQISNCTDPNECRIKS